MLADINMKFFAFILIISVAFGIELKIPVSRLEEIVDHVNSLQTTWKAANNFAAAGPDVDLSFSVGALLHRPVGSPCCKNDSKSEDKADQCENNGLPENFDARKQWSNCPSIGHIYDQGNCGSCWAVSVVSAFTDRLCIKSKGKIKTLRSTQQMTSCCHKCGRGCQGGWPLFGWEYLQREGAVTGGDYDTKEGCQPYRMKPCAHHVNGTKLPLCSSNKAMDKEPKCKLRCYNSKYSSSYKEDRVKAKTSYEVDPCAGQNEIYKNGPIVAAFAVFEDFYTYKSGVYKYTTGKLVGYHAVRVIGWGVDNKIPYWLVTNSWNEDWGDKGIFKIIRGDDELLFEEFFSAGEIA